MRAAVVKAAAAVIAGATLVDLARAKATASACQFKIDLALSATQAITVQKLVKLGTTTLTLMRVLEEFAVFKTLAHLSNEQQLHLHLKWSDVVCRDQQLENQKQESILHDKMAVDTVVEQAGCTRAVAEAAYKKARCNTIDAILSLC